MQPHNAACATPLRGCCIRSVTTVASDRSENISLLLETSWRPRTIPSPHQKLVDRPQGLGAFELVSRPPSPSLLCPSAPPLLGLISVTPLPLRGPVLPQLLDARSSARSMPALPHNDRVPSCKTHEPRLSS